MVKLITFIGDEYSSVSMSAYFGSVKYFEYLVAKEQCDPKGKQQLAS